MRTKRTGVLGTAVAAVLVGTAAADEHEGAKPVDDRGVLAADPGTLGFFRASAGTTWIQVGSNCTSVDTTGSTHGPDEVWCFEGADGDSTWPDGPGGTSQDAWSHWSQYSPPGPPLLPWHVTSRHGDAGTGAWNAWAGCDSAGVNQDCSCRASWSWDFREGYGNRWNAHLTLDASGQDASAGGTLEFSLRYDIYCDYDFLYLEYLDTASGDWIPLRDSTGAGAVFTAISGNPDSEHGGTGYPTEDIFHNSCYRDLGQGPVRYHGNSVWYHDVTFPVPAQSGGFQCRWRAFSDYRYSDEDGAIDTDGLAAIDNVVLTFAASGNSVTDDLETGGFDGILTSAGPPASWARNATERNTYDGWHLSLDPNYKNKGNTCTFSNDWMWAAKPDDGPIPENAFSFLLTSPVIPCAGWTGGVVEYSQYLCMPDERDDFVGRLIRVHDSSVDAWSRWRAYQWTTYGGCTGWTLDQRRSFSPFLHEGIDSLQLAWEVFDLSQPGDFSWGRHGGVQYLLDNASIGRFDASATVFTGRAVDLWSDTFSRSDPAHTPFLGNDAQGDWVGTGGGRVFVASDSLTVAIADLDGLDPLDPDVQVRLYWRADSGPGTAFEPWHQIPMAFALQDPTLGPGQGSYRAILGDDAGGIQDYTDGGDGLIWRAGQTVEYYLRVSDETGNLATFPTEAGDPVAPDWLEFSILPFRLDTDGNVSEFGAAQHILVVDDYNLGDLLDFEASAGFRPGGGAGFGSFDEPSYTQPERLVERALIMLYEGDEEHPRWDRYDVLPASRQFAEPLGEPRPRSDTAKSLGGYMDDHGVPYYDAIIWLQGVFQAKTYSEESCLGLAEYLDGGGCLLSNGDGVAFDLSAHGWVADPAFLRNYLGISFPDPDDNATDHRVLNTAGVPGNSLEGLVLGLYGECGSRPYAYGRRDFDRLTLAGPGVDYAASVLMTYANGGPNDDGRPSVIKCTRRVRTEALLDDPGRSGRRGGGRSVHAGFGLSALLSDEARAAFLGRVLRDDFGMTVTHAPPDMLQGVGAPVAAHGVFRFDLAEPSPNPFRERTEIRFSVPSRQHVSIDVFDVLGRHVRTIADETFEASSSTRVWDGQDEGGRRTSSGIYFCRMVAGDFSRTRKVVLLR